MFFGKHLWVDKSLHNLVENYAEITQRFVHLPEYEGDFYGQKAWFKVTSVAGHVYEINFPAEYNNWDRV